MKFMPTDSENSFLDTNILLYAYDYSAGEKHLISKKMVLEGMQGQPKWTISSQILGEFLSISLYSPEYKKDEIKKAAQEIIELNSWKKISYTEKTIEKAAQKYEDGMHFWDLVIAQTMLENGITTIYTENTKDFSKIKGIKAVNPFR
jgi:predicted nucleic acid-binding protein